MKKKIEFVGKSKSLSNNEKENLKKRLVNNSFEKRELKIKNKIPAFCDMVYAIFIGKYEKELSAMPACWKILKQNIKIAGIDRSWDSEKHMPLLMSKERIFPNLSNNDTPNVDVKEYPSVHNKIEKIDNEWSVLKEHRSRVRYKVEAALDQFKSSKQLFEGWPEAYAVYLELFPPEEFKYLPMIPVSDLNKELGL
jgi:hypothetical protein